MEIVVPDEFKYLYVQNAERPVVKIPDPVLRKVCQPVPKLDKKVNEFIDEMIAALKKANGVGIAAPQMGKALRLIIIAPHGMKPTALLNPVLSGHEGEIIGEEGCLSIPGFRENVARAATVVVEGKDLEGNDVRLEAQELMSRAFQHEIDHLDGILFLQHLSPLKRDLIKRKIKKLIKAGEWE